MLQDHDGDGGAAAAGLPLHRAQPHREGAHPLNGAPRPGSPCELLLRPLLHPTAIRESGSDILFQVGTRRSETGDWPSWCVCLHLLRVTSILDIIIFINRCTIDRSSRRHGGAFGTRGTKTDRDWSFDYIFGARTVHDGKQECEILPSFTVRGVIFPTSGVTKLIEFIMDVSGQINSIFGWVFSLFVIGRESIGNK